MAQPREIRTIIKEVIWVSKTKANQPAVQQIIKKATRLGLKLDSQEHLLAICRMINAAMAQITGQSPHSFQVLIEGPMDNPRACSFEIYIEQNANDKKGRTKRAFCRSVMVSSIGSIEKLVESVVGNIQKKNRSLTQQY